MSEVTRYSDMQIADAFTRFRMAIKGNTVPDTEMWVRAIDYDALRADFLNAVLGRDIAINERDALRAELVRISKGTVRAGTSSSDAPK